MQTVEIVKALRLCAVAGCGKCNGAVECGSNGCCCDALNRSAADRLEELLDRCARYAEEIAVLRERQKEAPEVE